MTFDCQALGSEVTFIEASDQIMHAIDSDVRRVADRLLIKPRPVDSRTGVFAAEVIPGVLGKKPVTLKLIDAKTKEPRETLSVDACLVATGRVPNTRDLDLSQRGIETNERGFITVDEKMRVLTKKEGGSVVDNLYCIGDANGKMMLAHAASAQVKCQFCMLRETRLTLVACRVFLLLRTFAIVHMWLIMLTFPLRASHTPRSLWWGSRRLKLRPYRKRRDLSLVKALVISKPIPKLWLRMREKESPSFSLTMIQEKSWVYTLSDSMLPT